MKCLKADESLEKCQDLECARQQLKEVGMKGLEVQAQLREQEKQKETELQLLRRHLEDEL